MRTRVQKWGNSLAVRIPKAFAAEIGLEEDVAVDLKLSNGRLLVEPARPPQASLGSLVRRITKKNLHAEVETGARVGRELW